MLGRVRKAKEALVLKNEFEILLKTPEELVVAYRRRLIKMFNIN